MAAYAWAARPSILTASRVVPSVPWRWGWTCRLLSVVDGVEVRGSSCRRWSALAADAPPSRWRLGLDGSRVTVRASHVNSAGSIDSPLMQSMADKIKEQLSAEFVDVKDAYGDGRHVSIDVVASSFEGQSAVARQRMVYKAIWEELQTTVHAVDQMTTRTPAEVQATTNQGTAPSA
ncbi:hypothetical protein MLD38_002804 [Melastoma candidum]|uniref:Uncharacterized protein n=1 Tax=Melastoma candidum TaxID=119954 RepID=A0ACB9S0J2_9MYRT|nr:hypothetical protein MLD38_002804 [Melastoma candidum]